MKKYITLNNPIFVSFLILLLFALSCANLKDKENSSKSDSPNNTVEDSNKSNSSVNENSMDSSAQTFMTEGICSSPKEVASGTPFADLGSGSWGKWSDSGGELDFGCNDGKDSIKLKKDENVDINAEYGAIGGENVVHYVSVEYMAMQYAGQTPDEKKLRQQYVEFCDKLSKKFYGEHLPEKFKKRLLDESTYSKSGTANEYGEKVGNGYVNLSSNKNKNIMILLDVHFFSSESEYKKYKDS